MMRATRFDRRIPAYRRRINANSGLAEGWGAVSSDPVAGSFPPRNRSWYHPKPNQHNRTNHEDHPNRPRRLCRSPARRILLPECSPCQRTHPGRNEVIGSPIISSSLVSHPAGGAFLWTGRRAAGPPTASRMPEVDRRSGGVLICLRNPKDAQPPDVVFFSEIGGTS
jgi:hypothetical protein